MNLKMILFIGAGGFLGTTARYLIGIFLLQTFSTPGVATLVVNILGSLVIGIVYGLGQTKFGEEGLVILTVGVLGGFTTFSAFSADAIQMIREEKFVWATGYVLSMVFICLMATQLGFILAKRYA